MSKLYLTFAAVCTLVCLLGADAVPDGAHHGAHHAHAHGGAHHAPHHAPQQRRRVNSFRSFVDRAISNIRSTLTPQRRSDLSTVGGIILVLIIIDVLFTLVLASGAVLGKRSNDDWGTSFFSDAMSRMYNSLDVVDLTTNYFEIEEEACKYKAVCRAANHPLVKLGFNSIRNYVPGLENYSEAVTAGLDGQDCDLIYDQCNQYLGF